MASIRVRRVAEVIRETAARAIAGELSDPRIKFVTVTGAEVTPDLQNARVYVSVLGSEADERTTMRALAHAAPVIQRACGRALEIRRTPEIAFEIDRSIARSARISELIREARRTDRDGGCAPAPEEAAPTPPAVDGESAAMRERWRVHREKTFGAG